MSIEFGLPSYYKYGTSGFRLKNGQTLETIVKICGVVAALRSKSLNGKGVGLMITASHNPKDQNGVKLVEPNGDMFIPEWENIAVKFVNSKSKEEFKKLLSEYDLSQKSKVWIGYDTRSSSLSLCESTKSVLKEVFGEKNHVTIDIGCSSTPQLHYVVYRSNICEEDINSLKDPLDIYFQDFSSKFLEFNDLLIKLLKKNKDKLLKRVLVDCASAVGSKVLYRMQKSIDKNILEFLPFNTCEKSPEFLNDGCGSDFVTARRFPRNWSDMKKYSKKNELLWSASFDGDADRVVVFYDDQNSCKVLNGDKISSLFGKFFLDVLRKSGLDKKYDISIGAVQTAYANGASTYFLSNLLTGDRVPCTPTGVKHLHHKAKDFSIGIYFEANGHGTVLFSPKFREIVKLELSEKQDESKIGYIKILDIIMDLINPSVGDAICDLLAILCCLNYLGIRKIEEWNAFYDDLPNLLTKVEVKDRTVIKTVWNETKVLEPKGIQEMIDEEMKKLNDSFARSFIRPSGTEDVVRVYAEASSMENARMLSENVELIVKKNL